MHWKHAGLDLRECVLIRGQVALLPHSFLTNSRSKEHCVCEGRKVGGPQSRGAAAAAREGSTAGRSKEDKASEP
eukprot:3427049-Alexandrium_andersonii.AAC.1